MPFLIYVANKWLKRMALNDIISIEFFARVILPLLTFN